MRSIRPGSSSKRTIPSESGSGALDQRHDDGLPGGVASGFGPVTVTRPFRRRSVAYSVRRSTSSKAICASPRASRPRTTQRHLRRRAPSHDAPDGRATETAAPAGATPARGPCPAGGSRASPGRPRLERARRRGGRSLRRPFARRRGARAARGCRPAAPRSPERSDESGSESSSQPLDAHASRHGRLPASFAVDRDARELRDGRDLELFHADRRVCAGRTGSVPGRRCLRRATGPCGAGRARSPRASPAPRSRCAARRGVPLRRRLAVPLPQGVAPCHFGVAGHLARAWLELRHAGLPRAARSALARIRARLPRRGSSPLRRAAPRGAAPARPPPRSASSAPSSRPAAPSRARSRTPLSSTRSSRRSRRPRHDQASSARVTLRSGAPAAPIRSSASSSPPRSIRTTRSARRDPARGQQPQREGFHD